MTTMMICNTSNVLLQIPSFFLPRRGGRGDPCADECWARTDEAALINTRGEGYRGAGTEIPARIAICKSNWNKVTEVKFAVLTIQCGEIQIDKERKLEIKNRAQTVLEYTVEKYTKLFPNATVTIGADYNRRRNDYTEFKTVIINFTSGSYVIYRLGYANDGEYFHKSFDGAVDTLKGIDLLNHFNNQ